MLDTLFSPLALGPVTIRNRIVSTSHQTTLVHDHLPTDDLIAYHEARARGGAGLIVIEATATHPSGLFTAHTIGGYLPEIVPVFQRLSEAVHEHGARLICQLFHGGREQISVGPRPPAVAPSAIPSARFKTEPRALTVREIHEMVDGYRQAARHAAEGGLDGVEVCAGFGYLPTQFLSPHANTRTDEYGGSFENRLRFLRELLRGDARGHRPRRRRRLPADPGGALPRRQRGRRGGGSRPRGCSAPTGLADYVSVTMGSSSSYRGSMFIVPPGAGARNVVEDFARGCARVGVPVIATGRILDPADADRLIAAGVCDAVGMTRAMIADPALARKARAGDPITTLHRLQPGLHRPLPRGPADRVHDQPVDGLRARPCPTRRGQPATTWSSSAPARPAVPPRPRRWPAATG